MNSRIVTVTAPLYSLKAFFICVALAGWETVYWRNIAIRLMKDKHMCQDLIPVKKRLTQKLT
jgi:hypothetical protein